MPTNVLVVGAGPTGLGMGLMALRAGLSVRVGDGSIAAMPLPGPRSWRLFVETTRHTAATPLGFGRSRVGRSTAAADATHAGTSAVTSLPSGISALAARPALGSLACARVNPSYSPDPCFGQR